MDLVPVTTGFGEPVGLTAIVRDVTLRKTLEEMKNDFVNTVSHDLKNPIAVIEGMATLIHRELPETGRQRERCETILDTTRFMAELVTDLLDLGKIEAGFDPSVEPLDVVPAVQETVKQLALQAEDKRIAVDLQLPDEVFVMATPGRLKQALLNLVSNAIKYTPEDGHVSVTVSTATTAAGAEIVVIRVKDTGFGIPAKDLPHVFDKFFRVQEQRPPSASRAPVWGSPSPRASWRRTPGASAPRAWRAPAAPSPSSCRAAAPTTLRPPTRPSAAARPASTH